MRCGAKRGCYFAQCNFWSKMAPNGPQIFEAPHRQLKKCMTSQKYIKLAQKAPLSAPWSSSRSIFKMLFDYIDNIPINWIYYFIKTENKPTQDNEKKNFNYINWIFWIQKIYLFSAKLCQLLHFAIFYRNLCVLVSLSLSFQPPE